MSYPSCETFGKMTALKRHRLPDSAFALPNQRRFPIPDPKHAKNAKARATQALKRKSISKREHKAIFTAADAVINACAKGLKGTKRVHWNKTQAKKYRAAASSCSRRNRCSSRRGKAKMACQRACKAAASRKV